MFSNHCNFIKKEKMVKLVWAWLSAFRSSLRCATHRLHPSEWWTEAPSQTDLRWWRSTLGVPDMVLPALGHGQGWSPKEKHVGGVGNWFHLDSGQLLKTDYFQEVLLSSNIAGKLNILCPLSGGGGRKRGLTIPFMCYSTRGLIYTYPDFHSN